MDTKRVFQGGGYRLLRKRSCSFCGKPVWRRKDHNHKDAFCDTECHSKFKKGKPRSSVELLCSNPLCKKPFRLMKGYWKKKKRLKQKNFFHTRQCASDHNGKQRRGENHHNYTDGRTSYRNMAFKHHGEKCENPNCQIKELHVFKFLIQVHHIDEDRKNNSLENLMVLCSVCHSLVTRKLAIIDKNRRFKLVDPTLEELLELKRSGKEEKPPKGIIEMLQNAANSASTSAKYFNDLSKVFNLAVKTLS